MEIQGKIISVLPERSGVSARGTEWKVQEYVLETHDQYPKKVMFDVFGQDRIDRFNIQPGQEVNVAFDLESREWNGRWFTSVRAFDVRPVDSLTSTPTGAAPQPAASSAPVVNNTAAPAATTVASDDDNGGLPF